MYYFIYIYKLCIYIYISYVYITIIIYYTYYKTIVIGNLIRPQKWPAS